MENTLLNTYLQEEVREGFKIESLEEATWAFRKLRAIENKEADIKATAEKEIAGIESWKDKELKQYESDKQYFGFLLEEYYKNEKAKDKKFKLSTPYGKVTARKSSKWNYENEEALVKYLKDNKPELVRVKEEVNKTELKKVFKDGVDKETGEILPFVTIEETETITVKAE
ncbi:MAG: host-nuclease inhibitor Gam family protein [Clostridium sp.]|uniref:host-nuclease inhibitor Gam family protein n=1 Tax=Clostridium TaxID=1485 RepID=UPI0029073541|nr:host-nuclease inhibitor Gam family protein [Clostridium sp.]MDU5209582.1 host-nuclease inhibitor Gam family protein [Clostridium sp.]MDU6762424.1 host-nuclease inhibitor Gam family protein [Clostridium sp.]